MSARCCWECCARRPFRRLWSGRTRVILALAGGDSYATIGARLGVTDTHIARWKKRSGRHRRVGAEHVHQIIEHKVRHGKPFLIALSPSATARCLLPTPDGPRNNTLVFSRIKLHVASVSIWRRSTRG